MEWTTFINSVTERYIDGKSEDEISQEFGGTLVEGEGTIERIETDSEYTPFIQVYMPKVVVQHGEKEISASFLCLTFNALAPEQVRGLSKGGSVNFRTYIQSSNGPFPGISVSEFEDEKEILIMPGTTSSEIV